MPPPAINLENSSELLNQLLDATIQRKASDLHLSANHAPHFRQQGLLAAAEDWPVFNSETMAGLATTLAELTLAKNPPHIGALDGALSAHEGT